MGIVDLIFMKLPCENGVFTWWFMDDCLQPNNRYQRNLWHIKEHQARNWQQMDLDRAVNVLRVRAYYDKDEKCQYYEPTYCEARISSDEWQDIVRMLATYWDIPF